MCIVYNAELVEIVHKAILEIIVVFALVLLMLTCTNIYGNIFKVNTHSFNVTPQFVIRTISVFRIFKFDSWLCISLFLSYLIAHFYIHIGYTDISILDTVHI